MTTAFDWKRGVGLATLVVATSAQAYGPEGHQTIGAIADRLLQGTATEAALRQIVGTDLKTVAVWADCARSVKDGKFEKNPRFPECDVFFSDKDRLERFVANNKAHTSFHFTNVSNLRRDYDIQYPGAATQDIVHAINGAIVVLRGQASPDPFVFADKREAVMLLSHYLGDLHQPLHAVSVYLDDQGRTVDPELVKNFRAFATVGGNALIFSGTDLHSRWDHIPKSMEAGGAKFEQMVRDARSIPRTSGSEMSWSRQWATETIQVGAAAFDGLVFDPMKMVDNQKRWPTSFTDEAAYTKWEDTLTQQELTRAGARLAQLLQAVLEPRQASCTASKPAEEGYLPRASMPDVGAWVSPAPDALSIAQLLDDKIFESTRPLLATPRGQSAAEDDVFAPRQVLDRFMPSIGNPAIPEAARTRLEAIMGKLENDASVLVEPMKKKVCAGGRVRPFVARPGTATCLAPVDMAGHADQDLVTFGLAGSG